MPRQNCHHFADDIFKYIFLNVWDFTGVCSQDSIYNFTALVHIMACADQATSHYLNQWWLIHWRIYASLGLNELIHRFWFRLPTVPYTNPDRDQSGSFTFRSKSLYNHKYITLFHMAHKATSRPHKVWHPISKWSMCHYIFERRRRTRWFDEKTNTLSFLCFFSSLLK